MDLPPPPRRPGEASKPVRYNPVPIGGPDRPPVNHSPSPGIIYASSPGPTRDGSLPSRRASSVRTGPSSPSIKREAGPQGDFAHPAGPPSAVTDNSESSSLLHPGDDENKSEDAEGESRKKRQKRNKPTLSCFECVERKTKVGIFFSLCSLSLISSRLLHFRISVVPFLE